MDKLKFESLTSDAIKQAMPESPEFHILIERDAAARTLSIHDNGIGMNRDDVVKLIGTIAKSGTREFMETLKNLNEQQSLVPPELIGQFGVGFYSTFMVADKVTLVTRKAGENETLRWESTGDGTYTLEALTGDAQRNLPGTTITLHLKPSDEEDGMKDYTEEWTIRHIVKKYSDFVAYPIQMDVQRQETEKDEDGKPKEGGKTLTVTERQTLNSMKAIWTRPQDEVSEEEYTEFYKHIAHDWNPPMKTIRMKMEGNFEAQSLLFIPGKAPMDLFYREAKRGIQLYVKRVFIMDECKDLMPDYLRFVKGMVDSEDLSLNISREILQQNRQIQAIRKRLIKKVLSTLEEMKENENEQFLTFWGEFGRALKEGLYEDQDNREQLLKLCLFQSTHDAQTLTGLTSYVERMKDGQDAIYYMTGETRQAVENSPHLEAFKDKNIEVLILTDPVDEIWIQSVFDFDGKPLKSVGKGDVELGTEDERKQQEEARKEKEKTYESLLECLKDKLSDNVKEVRLSNRLKQSASCLVGGEGDLSPQLEQMLKAMNQPVPTSKRILELNPEHPVLQKLQQVYSTNKEAPELGQYAQLLYGQAVLAEGGQLADPAQFSRLVAELMVKAV
jgi:molecular chaperone HtpG